MKSNLLVFFALWLGIGLFGQSQPEIRYTTGDFQPLNNATVLTTPAAPGDFWDDLCYNVTLTEPVFFNAYSLELTQMEICSDGRVTLSDPTKTRKYTVMPFRAEYIDKRVDETLLDASDILYETRNGFTTVEFRNVASRVEFGWYGSVNSTFTFQVRIEHSTGNIRFWYGESSYTQDLWNIVINTNEIAEAGLRVQTPNAHRAWVMTGSPSNISVYYEPVFNGNNYPVDRLREVPVDRTIIEYIWEPSTSTRNETQALDARLYPNPSRDGFTLDFDGVKADISLNDLQGREIWKKDGVQSGESILLPSLASGTYMVRILSNQKVSYHKWVKKD